MAEFGLPWQQIKSKITIAFDLNLLYVLYVKPFRVITRMSSFTVLDMKVLTLSIFALNYKTFKFRLFISFLKFSYTTIYIYHVALTSNT